MNLPNNLVQDFVKATKDKNESANEMTVYGVVNVTGDDVSVKLDGSDIYTPVVTSVKVRDGERVAVKLKNHVATIEGNFTSPAATDVDIQEVETEIVNTETRLDQVITQIKNNIIGGAGTGRYELIYKDDDVDKTVPIGFRIYNEDDDDIYWQFDYAGLRFTDDGGLSFKYAVTSNGDVVANKIAADSVIADAVEMQNLKVTGGNIAIKSLNADPMANYITLANEISYPYLRRYLNTFGAHSIHLYSINETPEVNKEYETDVLPRGIEIYEEDLATGKNVEGIFNANHIQFGGHLLDFQGENNDKLTLDYSQTFITIVEQGTSNGWTYRKYNDGTIEAWRKITPNIAFADSVGTNIKYTTGTTEWYFPSDLIETPVLTATPIGGYQIGVTAKSLTSSSFKLNYYRFSTAASAAVNSYPIHLHIIGRWK